MELALVRIRVAGGTGEVLKAVEAGVLSFRRRTFFMAISAGHGNVASGQDEASLLVLGQGEGRRPVAIQSVALLTAIQIRGGGELALMFVFMAVEAARELDFV